MDRVDAVVVGAGVVGLAVARALGLPNDPVEATGALLNALEQGQERPIGLGKAMTDGLPPARAMATDASSIIPAARSR